MNQNRNRRRNNNEIVKNKKIIRCKALNRPVFAYEVCDQFSSKISSNNQKNCENCLHTI